MQGQTKIVHSGPISRDNAILSLRYPISRDTFWEVSTLPKWCDTPPWYLVSHRHICAIPHFATYRVIIVRYPTKTSTREFCDTIAANIARYEKYRYWASKRSCGFPPTPGIASRVAPRIVVFAYCSSRETPFREWDFSFRELFLSSESCSENTPELTQRSKNGLSLRERSS